jgi:two-component system cell cycle response regulator DivK
MTTPKKVLVVEDHGDLLELMGKVLALLGWDAVLAKSGRTALTKLACDSPSVVLIDMGLPDMNGCELAGTLKKHPVYRKIPILAVSGHPGFLARARCLAAGCNDFISKPFAISALEARLKDLTSVGSKAKNIDIMAHHDQNPVADGERQQHLEATRATQVTESSAVNADISAGLGIAIETYEKRPTCTPHATPLTKTNHLSFRLPAGTPCMRRR